MPKGQGLVGDQRVTELPVTQIDEKDLTEEKKMAKFSKTAEFKRLKGYMENRIAYYQKFLPDGRPITAAENHAERGMNWVIANGIIGEFNELLRAYEEAAEVVSGRKDA